MPDNPLAPIRQELLGILIDKGVGFGSKRRGQHPVRPVPRNLGPRIVARFRLTQGNDLCIVLNGVSFLPEVLAGFGARHDTPPSQTSSPKFRHATPPEADGRNNTERPRDPARPDGYLIRQACYIVQNALRLAGETSPFRRQPELPMTAPDQP